MHFTLCSGLGLHRLNSFSTQLALLARGLRAAGHTCNAIGVSPRIGKGRNDGIGFPDNVPTRDVTSMTMSAVIGDVNTPEPDALILLGYPDQFAFLNEEDPFDSAHLSSDTYYDFPVFHWAQLSHAPATIPDQVCFVPLTSASRDYLLATDRPAPGSLVLDPIPHAVDTSVFRPVRPDERQRARLSHGLPPKSFIIGYVATNQLRKRLDRFVEASAAITRRLAGSSNPATATYNDIHFCIKTDRAESAAGFDLPRLINRHDTEGRTKVITDPMDEHRLSGLISCFDLYLHVSEWEGFGIPVIEALACGVPVATHRGQGPGEFTPFDTLFVEADTVRDESGALLSHIHPESAADAAEHVFAAGDAEGEALRQKARSHAEANFALAVVTDSWVRTMGKHAHRFE